MPINTIIIHFLDVTFNSFLIITFFKASVSDAQNECPVLFKESLSPQ